MWFAAAVVGLLLSALSLRLRRWPLLILVSASIYLITWYTASNLGMSPILGYEIKWAVAQRYGLIGAFWLRDVLQPLAFVFALLLAMTSALKRA